MNINWSNLAQIQTISSYWQENPEEFKILILEKIEELNVFNEEELQMIANIRTLDVTNGIVQWSYRLEREQRLPIEQTKKCMELSMSSIKQGIINYPNDKIYRAEGIFREYLAKIKELYISAFKRHTPHADKLFFATSVAQFLVVGKERMAKGFELLESNFSDLFTPLFINKARNYVQPYLDSIISE